MRTLSWRPIVLPVCVFLALGSANLPAQTFTVLHTFLNGQDGGSPTAELTPFGSGSFYGTTEYGGISHDGATMGVAFKLTREASGWVVSPLFLFPGGSNDAMPRSPIAIASNGALYGTTSFNAGEVYQLQPPRTFCRSILCYWDQTTVYSFSRGGMTGYGPAYGKLVFDQAGNIYGTTSEGGANAAGVAFELMPSGDETVIHNFGAGLEDGSEPLSGVIFDAAGNLYGTTAFGGTGEGVGTVYQLTPSGGSWTETILHSFDLQSEGGEPFGTLILDGSGNLYGTTSAGGTGGGGTVFELSPSNGAYTVSVLHSFSSCDAYAGVTMDNAGNLYGVCSQGGANNAGMVYKLTNQQGSWTFTDLYDFMGTSDGGSPRGAVVLDTSGNIYGTTYSSGNLSCDCGTIWEITP